MLKEELADGVKKANGLISIKVTAFIRFFSAFMIL